MTKISTDTAIERLHTSLSGVSEDSIKGLMGSCEHLYMTPREVLYREGIPPKGIYFIIDGKFKITNKDIQQSDRIIRFLAENDWAGVEATAYNIPSPDTAISLSKANVIMIPGVILREFLHKDHLLMMKLLSYLSLQADQVVHRATDILCQPVKERLASTIIMLSQKFGLNQLNMIDVSLSQDDIANLINASKSSVNRLLREFEAKRIIQLHRNGIRLLNQRALLKMTGE